MRFSQLGGFFQTNPGTEGDVLWKAGLLEKVWEKGWVVGFEPTAALREMFLMPFDMDTLYPLLVEMVCHYRHPAIANHGQPAASSGRSA